MGSDPTNCRGHFEPSSEGLILILFDNYIKNGMSEVATSGLILSVVYAKPGFNDVLAPTP